MQVIRSSNLPHIGLRWWQLLGVSCVLMSHSVGAVAQCPVDNFDDGDDSGWIHCGDWSKRQTPQWDASSGAYCLGLSHPLKEPPPPPLTIAAEWTQASSDPRYANGCVRAGFTTGNAEAGTWNTHFVLGLRADCKNRGYKAMLGPSLGRISIFRRLEIIADRVDQKFEQDTVYQAEFCAVGSALSLKVWAEREPEPTVPQLEAENEQFAAGNIGIGVFVENDNRGPIVRGCFDNISFVPSTQCRGDLNCDGAVNSGDIEQIASQWGDAPHCRASDGDVNGDCTVGFLDLLEVTKAWGDCAQADDSS